MVARNVAHRSAARAVARLSDARSGRRDGYAPGSDACACKREYRTRYARNIAVRIDVSTTNLVFPELSPTFEEDTMNRFPTRMPQCS